MAKQLTYRSLDNIGINGLNTQFNPLTLDITWLTKAENVMLKETGSLSVRKGLKQNILKTSAKIGSMVEHNDSGTNKVFASVGTSIYIIDFGSPDEAFPTGTKHTVSSSTSDWQFVNFNNKLYGFQNGVAPVEYSGSWINMSTKPSSVSGTFDPSCATGYYGRLWVGGVSEARDVVYYSDTLIGTEWREEVGGVATSAGYIDLKTVWGTDEIVAVAPFYGQLVIFGKHNIAIYNNPSDPNAGTTSPMALTEVIRGIGCVSRDSVQAIGDDLMFLSSTGLRSLSRTTELDKVPLTELSINIKDTLISNINNSTNVKSVYVENEGIYVMSFVDLNITYVFDIKHATPNKAPRITTWTFTGDRHPTCLAYTDSRGFLVGQEVGSIASYEGYSDVDYPNGNQTYTGSLITTWIETGEGVSAALLKTLKATFDGGLNTTVDFNWYKDFGLTAFRTDSRDLEPSSSGEISEYGIAEYNIAEYAPLIGQKEYSIPLSGSAKHLKLGINMLVNNNSVSLQDLTLLYKQGKLR